MNNELKLLLQLSAKLYRPVNFDYIDINQIDLNLFKKMALENNMLFMISQEVINSEDLSEEFKLNFIDYYDKSLIAAKQVVSSLRLIKEKIPNYLLIKTFRGENFFRIGNDLDVLVRSDIFGETIKTFTSDSFIEQDYDHKEMSVQLLKEDYKKIHLQSDITWCWTRFMDYDAIFLNPREVVYHNEKILVPNYTVDFMIHIAHMNFEPLHILLSEIFYLFKIAPHVDIKYALEQSSKYKWKRTFLRTVAILNMMHSLFYGKNFINMDYNISLDLSEISFPFSIPRKYLISNCIEKRLLIYPLLKVFKVLKVLFNNKTYRFIIPPEQEEYKK